MKGVVLLGNRKCCVKDFPVPTPGYGEVLVRMKATGICGSDLHIYHISEEAAQQRGDRIPGHEPSGIVESLGEGVNNIKAPKHSTLVLFVDKEEIGSVGTTGAQSQFLVDCIRDLCRQRIFDPSS